MTNEEMLGVAEIVERATNRFNEQAARFRERSAAYDRLITDMNADHERKMAEHRAAFGARTEDDAKIIEGLRADVEDLRNRLNLLGIKAAKQAGEALGMVEGEGLLCAAKRVVKERDALRAEVAELKTQLERLTSWAAKNQAARETLQTEIERLTQTPKHPVKVGEWVRMTSLQGSPSTMKQVSHLWIDKELYGFADGEYCRFSHCKPCDPPTADHDAPAGKAAAASVIRDDRNTEPKPGDTVRMIRIPTPGPDFDGLIDFPWNTDWGAVGDVAAVVATLAPTDPPVAAVRVSSGIVVWWPLSCVEVVRTEPDEEVDTTPADEE